ncbi:MAG: hypothetical protein V2J24_08830 [Pseudomonadales bacterium]|jgi:hypothetical protein|nr:hypothetical protein [Pseudomonadales bacterium]
MSMLSILLATSIVPPAVIALFLVGLLCSVGLDHWQQARPRFAPIFVRPGRPPHGRDQARRRDRR